MGIRLFRGGYLDLGAGALRRRPESLNRGAGGAVLVHGVTVALAGIALSYSVLNGLKASVVSDWAQVAFILHVSVTLIPWAVHEAGGFDALLSGLGGKEGGYSSLFSANGFEVFYSFGTPRTWRVHCPTADGRRWIPMWRDPDPSATMYLQSYRRC